MLTRCNPAKKIYKAQKCIHQLFKKNQLCRSNFP